MKEYLLGLMKHLPRASVLRSLVFVLGFGYIGFAYASLFPGPLTGHMVDEDPIGGYVSHAQFERGCSHCHEPLHCIGEDRCQACHVEVAEQKAEMTGLHGLLPGTNRCQNCHVEHQGREADITTLAFRRIDHASLANFSLDYHQADYAGSPMDCQSCHLQDNFVEASLDCVTCHAEEDHEMMATHIDEHGLECLSCHDGTTRLANFEHNVQAFNLTGAHTEVACEECHNDPELQYGEAPTECKNCHGEEDQPESHPQFGNDCQRCHETMAWAPARLTQHTFDLNHALTAEGEIDCQACHQTTYAAVECMGCHTEGGRVEAEHASLGVVDMANCLECHPTGAPGELQRASNFPGKAGSSSSGMGAETPLGSQEIQGNGQQAQEAALPAIVNEERTFHYKGDGQAPNKAHEEGDSTQP